MLPNNISSAGESASEIPDGFSLAGPNGGGGEEEGVQGGKAHPPTNKCLNEYKRAPGGDLRPLYARLAKRWPLLLYSGDADSCVPHVGTDEWVHELGFPVAEPWRPWLSLANGSGPIGTNGTSHIYEPDGRSAEAQRVGYVTSFGGAAVRLLFATVNGAGHEVPMYKPVASYAMLSRFIAGRAL